MKSIPDHLEDQLIELTTRATKLKRRALIGVIKGSIVGLLGTLAYIAAFKLYWLDSLLGGFDIPPFLSDGSMGAFPASESSTAVQTLMGAATLIVVLFFVCSAIWVYKKLIKKRYAEVKEFLIHIAVALGLMSLLFGTALLAAVEPRHDDARETLLTAVNDLAIADLNWMLYRAGVQEHGASQYLTAQVASAYKLRNGHWSPLTDPDTLRTDYSGESFTPSPAALANIEQAVFGEIRTPAAQEHAAYASRVALAASVVMALLFSVVFYWVGAAIASLWVWVLLSQRLQRITSLISDPNSVFSKDNDK